MQRNISRTNLSKRMKSNLDDSEQILWYSRTNVLPQLIASIPGILLFGGFFGIWAGLFFGGFASIILGTFTVGIVIGTIGFVTPMVLLAVQTYYESKREEFVVTDEKLIAATANNMSTDMDSVPRNKIKGVGVKQGLVGDMMSVGDISFEVYQTDMQTDMVVFEGIDKPYDELSKLREILSDDLDGESE